VWVDSSSRLGSLTENLDLGFRSKLSLSWIWTWPTKPRRRVRLNTRAHYPGLIGARVVRCWMDDMNWNIERYAATRKRIEG